MEKSFNLSISMGDTETIEGLNVDSFFSNAKNLEGIFSSLLLSDILPEKEMSGAPQIAVDIVLVSDHKIRELNRNFRKKDSTTDVISLALYEDFRLSDDENSLPVIHLGDVFISLDTAGKQAKTSAISLEQELIELMIHGILHLFGYDHEVSTKEKELMYSLERKIYKIYSNLS